MSIFLTESDIEELTGCKTRKGQCAWLESRTAYQRNNNLQFWFDIFVINFELFCKMIFINHPFKTIFAHIVRACFDLFRQPLHVE